MSAPTNNTTGFTPSSSAPAPLAKTLSMFESARFKLTMFYLAVILVLSLTLTLGTRTLAQHEYERSNLAQRGAFQGIIMRNYGVPLPAEDGSFGFQRQQERVVRERLNLYVELINLAALVIGGIASWWFAGRTLRPIEAAHNAQKRFASDASHELRTPLAAMRIENEVFLRQKTFPESAAREQIQSNLEEVDRLERLAANLLALTDYESASLGAKQLNLKALVDDAVRQTKRSHPKTKVHVSLQKGQAVGHHDSLVQLLTIILDNACKYAPGKPVELTSAIRDDTYDIEIRDHGPGIASADLPHIFDRLYRGDKARSQAISGHGLGLALAKQISKANNATLSAHNHSEGGAVFVISLPQNTPSI